MLKLAYYRDRYNMSQQAFADFAGVSRQLVSRIEVMQAKDDRPNMDCISFRAAAAIMDALFALVESDRTGERPEVKSMPKISTSAFGRNIWSFYCPEDFTTQWLEFWLSGWGRK